MRHNEIEAGAGCAGAGDEAAGCVQAFTDGQESVQPRDSGSSAGCAKPGESGSAGPEIVPPKTLREFERALRALGFSRQQAANIARRGFAGIAESESPQPLPVPAPSKRLHDAAERLVQALKGM